MSPINIAMFYEAASQIILGCHSMPEVVLAIFKCFYQIVSFPTPSSSDALTGFLLPPVWICWIFKVYYNFMTCCRLRFWPVLKKKTLRSLQMATSLLASCTWCLVSFYGSLLPSSVWSAPGLLWPSALWAIGNR